MAAIVVSKPITKVEGSGTGATLKLLVSCSEVSEDDPKLPRTPMVGAAARVVLKV